MCKEIKENSFSTLRLTKIGILFLEPGDKSTLSTSNKFSLVPR